MSASTDSAHFSEDQIERRSLYWEDINDPEAPLLRVEKRSASEHAPAGRWLVGYAVRFGVKSLKIEDFHERIDKRAFGILEGRSKPRRPIETRGLFNHNPDIVLGRYPKTMFMRVDDKGLRYEIMLPESRSDIAELIERGDITGSSFTFVMAPRGEEWGEEEGRSVRTVTDIAAILDVGPVTFPAYPDPPGSSVAVARRSYEMKIKSPGSVRREASRLAAKQKRAEIDKFIQERKK